MSKSVQKIRARELRKQGQSIKEIAKKLKVSPSSVSTWCRDIELTPKQTKTLEERARDPYYGRRGVYLASLKRKQNLKINKLIKEGAKEIGNLTKRELFLVGVALYWGEGFKKDKQAGIANQDPKIINMFIKWLQVCFGYRKTNLVARVIINSSHKSRAGEIQHYWSKQTGIPMEQFRKPTLQTIIWKKKYENPNDYYGVLRIKVRKSADFLRSIYGFIAGLKANTF
ncbi:hypothetical protein HYT60_01735 [Candidatus Woesebacteria bacterium]|nr:hypothetical protein [Candidatus Woesebacteria bacterium]